MSNRMFWPECARRTRGVNGFRAASLRGPLSSFVAQRRARYRHAADARRKPKKGPAPDEPETTEGPRPAGAECYCNVMCGDAASSPSVGEHICVLPHNATRDGPTSVRGA